MNPSTDNATEQPSGDESQSTSRHLGLTTLAALVVANMIGVGVYTSSGHSLAALQAPGQVMLAWWLCGLWAVCGAIGYGALTARLPESGGEYLFLSRLVHPSIGFLAGWISIIAGFTAPIAAAAKGAVLYAFPQDASTAIGDWSWFQPLMAAGLIAVATVCHLIGVRLGTAFQNILVAIKLLLIAAFLGWAYLATDIQQWPGLQAVRAAEAEDVVRNWIPKDWNAWLILAGSMSWIALSYTGFNAAVYVAGESRSARRIVPLAMIVGTLITTAVYLLLNYVFVYGPLPEQITGNNEVAAIAAETVGGARWGLAFRSIIVLSLCSSVFAMLLTGPRVYQQMAADGVMPSWFSSGDSLPRVATIVQATLSIIAIFVADLLQILTYLGLTLSACGALAVMSLLWVHRQLPNARRLNLMEYAATGVYLLITAAILYASRTAHSDEFTAMMVTFGIGVAVYLLSTSLERKKSQ